MASIPVHAYSSPQIRRAMLGQRKGNVADTDKNNSKPLDIALSRPSESPLASPSPLSNVTPNTLPITSSDQQKKVQFLAPPPMTIPTSSSPKSITKPETKVPDITNGAILQAVKPYFTPPTARKQLFFQFRSASHQPAQQTNQQKVQQKASGSRMGSSASALLASDDAISFAFPSSELTLASDISMNRRQNRFTSADM